MIISIHQPNYLPYYGYFNKIKNSDIFVFLDNVPFSKNSYINRNRIKTHDGIKWLTVPVINNNILNTEIKDVKIFDNNWKWKHLKTIETNYKKTPNYIPIYDLLENIFAIKWDNIASLNETVITDICKYLNIKTTFVLASNLGVSGKSTDLLLNICKELKADTYLAGSSGINYIEEKKFTDSNISLIYQTFEHPIYNQHYGEFVYNLSILDMLMYGVNIT
jgi:hypothetical protein